MGIRSSHIERTTAWSSTSRTCRPATRGARSSRSRILPQTQSWLIALQQEAVEQADLAYWVAGKISLSDAVALVPPIGDPDRGDVMRRIQRRVRSLGHRIAKVIEPGPSGCAAGTVRTSVNPWGRRAHRSSQAEGIIRAGRAE